ncbi:MAG: hypothetical protein M1269_08935 [Chloroflexi bacterium]|nr:hypothetical protein [Chloroflexota bacterium]
MKSPVVSIEDFTLPRLIIGSSPFLGAGQFGARAQIYYEKFFLHPENISELLVYFARTGEPGAHLCLYEPLVEAARMAFDELGGRFPLIATLMPGDDMARQWDWVKELNVGILFLHATITDRIYRRELEEFCNSCREIGVIPGFSTHRPGWSIPKLDSLGIDAGAYLAAFNLTGKHVHPDLDSTLEAVENTHAFVIGMKVLAAGELKPGEAFPFALDHVPAITVGITTKEEVDASRESFNNWLSRA